MRNSDSFCYNVDMLSELTENLGDSLSLLKAVISDSQVFSFDKLRMISGLCV